MKPVSILVAVVLWGASVAAAYWFGQKNSTSSSTVTTVSSPDGTSGNGPGKPAAPGNSTRALADGAAGNAAGGAPSLQQIMAQIKLLARSGGMNNPSAGLKIVGLIGQIPEEDIPKALEAAEDSKEPQMKMMLQMVLLSRWAEKDGPAALKYAEEHAKDGPMAGISKMGVLSSWAQSDPEAAWQWMKDHKDEEEEGGGMFGGRAMMMTGLFSALASKDPEKAFQRLAEVEDKQQRTMALAGMAQTAWDDESRARLLKGIDSLPDAAERGEAKAGVLGQMAMVEPEAAIAEVAKLPDDERKTVAQRVGSMLMMSDPKKGADFMVANAPAGEKSSAYQQAVSMWAHQNTNAAGEWLSAQPQGPELDGARVSFASTAASKDPESAMEWAKTVTDENQRSAAITSVYTQWKAKNADAANAALDASGLPADRIEGLKSMKPVETGAPGAFVAPF